MGNKRIVLYLLLGVIMMALWNAWFAEHPTKQQATTSVTQNSAQAVTPDKLQVGPQSLQNIPPTKKAVPAVTNQNIPLHKGQVLATVDTDVLHLVFNTQGDLMQAALKKYTVSIKDKSPIMLLNNNSDQYYQMQSGVVNASKDNGAKDKLVYTTAKPAYEIKNGSGYIDVKFIGKDKQGLQVTKVYRILKNSYAISLKYTIKNTNKKAWAGSFYGQIQRTKPLEKKGVKFLGFHFRIDLLGFHSYSGTSFSTVKDPYNKISFRDFDKKAYSNTTRGGWLAMQQHYFLSAWVPRTHDVNNYYGYAQNWSGRQLYTIGFASNKINLTPNTQTASSATFYVGPELVDQLNKVAPHLSLTIDYGWLWWIAAPIFKVLSWVHGFVGNWGFSIIIITLMMQLLFYKLNEKSFTSMARMRDAQPRMKQIQEQHSGDKQAASKAMMEFYRDEGINPLGGCFPIVVQIPVFFALYCVLGENVVLRQAPFILWIHDLSLRDPYFILPLLMGASMFVQQRFSPAPTDPTQAKMMMFMPVFMTGLFLFFPAGLVLYWVTRNVTSIAQQRYISKKLERAKLERKRKR